ncbi:hypothetical protein [Nocardia wallacei]|uniref:Uncharacterized protein n=1 Tax=Nocardia wallacei TaxID=480035 RepID=A0A7G1KDN3_9NOCA|nr:hypothetical protein [Nocardia wallacei]BCK53155.1 hypothetical protein NWFMUON74_09270 [Nocardia wallacei]
MIDAAELTADPQLTRGEPGLRRLQEFIEPYAGWTGSNAPSGYDSAALRALYDAERGLDLTDLATFADTLSAQLIAAREQAGMQSNRAGWVGAAWTEGAGVAAAALLSQVAARVGTDVEKLAGLATSIGTALTEIAASLRRKADTSETVFGALTIGGKHVSEVEQIARYAQGDFGLVADDGKHTVVRAVLPDLPDDTDPRQYAADWMNETFVPELETRVSEFATLNQNTRTTISQHYAELLTTFDGLDHSPYPGPAQAGPVSSALYSDTTPAVTASRPAARQQVPAVPESPIATQNGTAQGAVAAAPNSQLVQQQQSTPAANAAEISTIIGTVRQDSGDRFDNGEFPPGNDTGVSDATNTHPVSIPEAMNEASTAAADERSAMSDGHDRNGMPAAFGMPMMPPRQQGPGDRGEHRSKIKPHKSIFATADEAAPGAEPILVPATITASTMSSPERPNESDEAGASEATVNDNAGTAAESVSPSRNDAGH